MIRTYRHGRRLDDFEVGAVFEHPWEVTIDDGMVALFYASFQDAFPTYANRVFAAALGLRERPVHPLLLLNLGISFGVHDVSEQAIANLGYWDVRFPNVCHAGDTVRARSKVTFVKPVSSNNKGVVHVRTHLVNERDELLCSFERKALVRAGRATERQTSNGISGPFNDEEAPRLPAPIRKTLATEGVALPKQRFGATWESFNIGDIFAHEVGRTVSEGELMTLATLLRNSHPLHTDEVYCKTGSFVKTRVAFGGLVLSWALSLSSRDIAGNAIWDLGLDEASHTGSVLASDTLFSASKVIAKEPYNAHAGLITLRVIGIKNTPSRILLGASPTSAAQLFEPELPKTSGRAPEKVVEITRRLLVQRET